MENAAFLENMNRLVSPTGELLFCLHPVHDETMAVPGQHSLYTILFLEEGEGTYHADFGVFPFKGPMLLFSTPLQVIYMQECHGLKGTMIQFHGDFYCIEYHKTQVGCNGLLFNNIYIEPSIALTNPEVKGFKKIVTDMEEEFAAPVPDEMVLQSYLQLFLARSSSAKLHALSASDPKERDEQMEQFMQLLEKNFLTLHKPNDYANLLAMTPNTFSKRCVRYFKKTPSTLIQERLILEAKKKLHLTRQSIKEIAHALNFEDESYFSRFFKKFTNVSPQTFRDKTGISVMADVAP